MRHRALSIAVSLVALVMSACAEQPAPATIDTRAADGAHVVEVRAVHDHAADRHLFEISATEFPSGWTQFKFTNASPVDHFFLIWRFPEEGLAAAEAAGETPLEHWRQGVVMSFSGFDAYLTGEVDFGTYLDGLIGRLYANAPWFVDPGAPPMGGPGFTAAGGVSTTTVHLEPGEYIVECYVRDENGVFHSAVGMLDHLTVTDETTGADAPAPTAHLVISSRDGIRVDRELEAGDHVVSIYFEDQEVYENLVGHNVQLVQLSRNDDALLDDLAKWMDWRNKEGLVNRAPEGARFLGGVMEMTAGATGYFHVALEPGDYAWIAEVPDPASHGMLRTFTVAE